MQFRTNGVTVNYCPKYLCDQPTDETHTIVCADEWGEKVVLPLILNGVTSCLPVWSLIESEWQSAAYPRVTLTNADLTWDPSSHIYADQENAICEFRGKIIRETSVTRGPLMVINQVTSSTTVCAADIYSDEKFANVLKSNGTVTLSEIKNSNNKYGDIKSKKGKQVDSKTLSKRWNIDFGKSKRNVQRTTKRGVWSCINLTLSRRYPTNDRMLRYKRMPDPVFSDTLKAGTLSKRGNKYGQAYCTSYGWSICHPMAKKSEYHDTLSLVFKQDGVPTKMIVENSREQSLGEFERKCKEADCHLVNTEPFPHWSQLAEGCIRELKRLSS